jgi:hypothetical protein
VKEFEFENILARYPELIESGLVFSGRQVPLGRLHVDLLFRDKHGQLLIIELKRGPILREHIAQIFDYEGYFLESENSSIRVMLIGNRVPPNMRRSLEHHGFEWREFTEPKLIEYLQEMGDQECLAYFDSIPQSPTPFPIPTKTPSRPPLSLDVSVDSSRAYKGNLTVSDKMRALFGRKNLNSILTRKEIIHAVLEAYPGTNPTSVIPSDYCYNQICKGAKYIYLFENLNNSGNQNQYRVLGENHPYTGAITWRGTVIGEWKQGETKPHFYSFPEG